MTFASGTSFEWFAWHPLFESLGIALFSAGFRKTVDPSKIGVVLSYTLSSTSSLALLNVLTADTRCLLVTQVFCK